MSNPWMPLYVADYLADTRRLSTLEHGAYMLLIMDYWRHGNLPDDDSKLARIAGLTEDGWLEIRSSIASFFDDGWKHKRIDDELAKSSAKTERRVNAGRKGGLAKADKQNYSNATILPEQKDNIALASSSQPQSELETKVSNKSEREARSAARERMAEVDVEFEGTFWPGYPHKVGKPDARKAFHKARLKVDLAAIMAGLRAYVAGKPSWQEWKSPAAWLNAERWSDQPAPSSSAAILPFGHDPPRAPMTEAEKIAAAKKFDEDYRAGRLS